MNTSYIRIITLGRIQVAALAWQTGTQTFFSHLSPVLGLKLSQVVMESCWALIALLTATFVTSARAYSYNSYYGGVSSSLYSYSSGQYEWRNGSGLLRESWRVMQARTLLSSAGVSSQQCVALSYHTAQQSYVDKANWCCYVRAKPV